MVFSLLSWVSGRGSIGSPRGLELVQHRVKSPELGLPEVPVPGDPVGRGVQGRGLEAAEPAGAVLVHGDQARALEDLQVLRDGRLAHLEGLGQLSHRRLAGGEPRQDGATVAPRIILRPFQSARLSIL